MDKYPTTDSLPRGVEYYDTSEVVVKVYNWTVFACYFAILYFAAETLTQVRRKNEIKDLFNMFCSFLLRSDKLSK